MTTMTTMTMMRPSVGWTRGGATARRGATVVSRAGAGKAPTTVEYVMVDAMCDVRAVGVCATMGTTTTEDDDDDGVVMCVCVV